MSAKSFGRYIQSFEELVQVVATYTAHAAQRLRSQRTQCGCVTVFLATNRFDRNTPQYHRSASRKMLHPTAFTPDLVRAALDVLKGIFRPGIQYKKAGVFLSNIRQREHLQLDLFGEVSDEKREQQERLMETVDRVNLTWGQDTLFFGVMGIQRTWLPKQRHRSRHFTTRWAEILEAHAR